MTTHISFEFYTITGSVGAKQSFNLRNLENDNKTSTL